VKADDTPDKAKGVQSVREVLDFNQDPAPRPRREGRRRKASRPLPPL
jgi:hypothetical protein